MKIFRTLLLFSILTGVIWVAAAWRWQVTHRDMTMGDIVTDLVLLPLTVIALLLALRWSWRAAGRQAAAAASSATSSADDAATAAAPREASRHPPIKLLAAHARSAAGDDLAALLEAARTGDPRPRLDAELRTTDGLPVMCARIDSLESESTDESIKSALAQLRAKDPSFGHDELSAHAVRALSALLLPLQQAIEDLRPWSERLGASASMTALTSMHGDSKSAVSTEETSGGHVAQAVSPAPSLLRVVAAWPIAWTAFEQAVALAWLCSLFTVEATGGIPSDRIVFDVQAGGGEELWLRAEHLLQAATADAREDLVLLLACDSGLSETSVEAMQRQRQLFSAVDCPRGRMPGEAAAALVLAPASWPDASDDDEPDALRLCAAAAARSEQSVETGRRVSADCLRTTLESALQASQLAASEVGALVCDADQHSARPTELFSVTVEQLAQLDPSEDMRLIGTTTGHTGVVSVLLVIAAAAEHARETQQPTVALTLGDAFMRLALVVRPNGIASS